MAKFLSISKHFLIALLLISPINAMADELDVDQLMKDLEQQLQIGQEKYERLKPELKSALEEKSRDLSSTLDTALDQGLTELEKLGEQYQAASKASSEKLQEYLESDDVTEFRAFLSGLDEDAIREGRDQLVAKFMELLRLTADQVETLKPLLRDKLEQLGVILKRYLDDGKNDVARFSAEFEAEIQKNIEQFREGLNPEQFEKYEEQLNSIEETIKNDVFET